MPQSPSGRKAVAHLRSQRTPHRCCSLRCSLRCAARCAALVPSLQAAALHCCPHSRLLHCCPHSTLRCCLHLRAALLPSLHRLLASSLHLRAALLPSPSGCCIALQQFMTLASLHFGLLANSLHLRLLASSLHLRAKPEHRMFTFRLDVSYSQPVVGSGPLATSIAQPAMLASLQLLSISQAFGSPTVVTRSAAMLLSLQSMCRRLLQCVNPSRG